MTTEHTPAPWYAAKDYYGGWSIRTGPTDATNIDGRTSIFENTGRSGGEPTEADARLMAAAPELLAALETLDRTHNFADTIEHEDWGLYEDAAIPEIRAAYQAAIDAIAKARGQS